MWAENAGMFAALNTIQEELLRRKKEGKCHYYQIKEIVRTLKYCKNALAPEELKKGQRRSIPLSETKKRWQKNCPD